MSISHLEAELFKEWESYRPGLIRDGAINEELYNNSSVKVLYILKEVNGGRNWDLRYFLQKGGRASTWNNIARWQYGISNLNREVDWIEIKNINSDFRRKQIASSAIMNLKKDSGGNSANPNEIWTYAWDDRLLLRRQVAIYDADLIICCGTGEIVRDREIIYKWKKEDWRISKSGIKYYILENNHKKQIIISFCHPASRSSSEYMFYQLINTIKEIYK